MANIGTLAVSITANTEKFTKGLQSAASQLTDFSAKMAGYGTVAASAALAGLSVLVENSMEAIDNTAKLSDRLGIATEQLTGLQHAADLAGVSQETLSGGLEKLMKNLKPGEDPSIAIMQIADTIQSMRDPVERAQFAMEMFGKSGQQLIPMLAGGAAGLREMAAENEKFAGSFSRIDAAKVEAANDALTNVWNVFKGIGNTLAVAVAPFIEAVAKQFTAWATSGEGLKKNTQGVFDAIILGAAQAADYLSGLEATWYSLKAAVAGFTLMLAEALKLQIDFYNLPGKLATGKEIIPTDSIKNFIDITRTDAQQAIKDMDKAAGDFANGTWSQKAVQSIRDIQIEAEKAGKKIAGMQTAGSNIRAEMENKATAELNQRPQDAMEGFQDFAAEKAQKDMDEWAERMKERMKTPWDIFNEESEKAMQKFKDSPEELGKALDLLAADRDRALGPIKAAQKGGEFAAGEFKTFDLSRIDVKAISGGAKKQEVKAPELEEVLNKQLGTQKAMDAKLDKLAGLGALT